MSEQNGSSCLAPALRERVLERLGFSSPPRPDLDGLGALFEAWCMHVPFDNVRKMIALRTGAPGPLPGGHAEDFFSRWLSDGTGGTCWPTANALFELARSLGFQAQRGAAQMGDLGITSHATVRVRMGEEIWLVDGCLLPNRPLPLQEQIFIHTDPMFAVEVEPADEGSHLVWARMPPHSHYRPCRILAGEATHAFYLERYEASRERSVFNQRLFARRNRPGELLVVTGNAFFVKTAAELSSRDLSPDELRRALHEEFGLSGRVIEEWVRCGGMEASFEPPSGPKPPADTRKPPSQR